MILLENIVKKKKKIILPIILTLAISMGNYLLSKHEKIKPHNHNKSMITNIEKIIDYAGNPSIKNLEQRIPYSNQVAIKRIKAVPVKETLRYIIIGDTMTKRNKTYKKLLKQIKKLDIQPEFIFHLGDFVNSGRKKDYKKYLNTIKDCEYPIIHVMGNHEVKKKQGKMYFQRIFGKENFHFDYGNNRFIIMSNADSRTLGLRKYGFSEKQLTWLEDLLDDKNPEHKSVFIHTPPKKVYTKNTSHLGILLKKTLYNEKEFVKLVEQYNVQMVVSGHHHLFATFMHNGVRYLSSGGGGQHRDIWPGKWNIINKITRKHHFIVFDQKQNENYKGYVVKLHDNPNINHPDFAFCNKKTIKQNK